MAPVLGKWHFVLFVLFLAESAFILFGDGYVFSGVVVVLGVLAVCMVIGGAVAVLYCLLTIRIPAGSALMSPDGTLTSYSKTRLWKWSEEADVFRAGTFLPNRGKWCSWIDAEGAVLTIILEVMCGHSPNWSTIIQKTDGTSIEKWLMGLIKEFVRSSYPVFYELRFNRMQDLEKYLDCCLRGTGLKFTELQVCLPSSGCPDDGL